MSQQQRVPDNAPVVVGVGQWTRHPANPADSPEPAAMMAETIRRAAADAGAGSAGRLLHAVTGLWTVAMTSWSYDDPAAVVAEKLGIAPRHKFNSSIGGEQPQVLISRAARAIAAGEHDAVIISGAEAFRSRRLAKATGTTLAWTPRQRSGYPNELLDGEPSLALERQSGASIPLDFYAIFENAIRAAAARSLTDHTNHLGQLWHRFAVVAEGNEHAWTRVAPAPEQIITPSTSNRMVRYPYTKLLTSNIFVDMSASIIVTSAGTARALGISTDQWVFPLAAAEGNEHWFVSERQDLHRSVAIAANGQVAFALAGVHPSDIRYADLYSCFPSAVQIAAGELGLPLDDAAMALTVTGGLTFGGGPGNNYVTHAVASLVDSLRHDPGTIGLSTANGMFLTKHALALYSTRPPRDGFRWTSVQDEVDASPKRVPAPGYRGPARLESYTVAHRDDDGTPAAAVLIGITPDERRCWGNTASADLLQALEAEEYIGRSIQLQDNGIEID
ncbi:thiolase C-terminal domain-containing protein [Mycolicibacterium porcinum]|uniref:Acetyl-CoA acetyltransferase n=1 Tax=Mycolicibacterium porcinum TaxID=39693 RepID=A0AAW5SVV5_9MYCO|nr:hypothetical protein [Mycolicibacterium porcinum]MCV7386482.1 hypothetical protein [Mycolicibacterium porcinum]ORB39024.1 hypothetical protein BST41_18585 [Mycolicibacterium porcinum]CDO30848.1 acetyl-CoA acetyltransferase [Mycolicibacterium vulneris]